MSTPVILVVIVNYRTTALVIGCLRSLERERQQHPGLRAVVVDNASGDGSAKRLQAALNDEDWRTWARVHASETNTGFGAGNNVALREDLDSDRAADFHLILNPDTEVLPGCLSALLDFFSSHPHAGILGPRTESTPGTADCTAFRYPGLASEFPSGIQLGIIDRIFRRWLIAPPPRSEAHPTDWVSGGCMFLRGSVLPTVGLFDESFFLYFEEIDLCRRAAKAGFETWYVPQGRIMHWAGASTGIASDTAPSKRMPSWWFESRNHYLRKSHGLAYLVACNLAFTAGRTIRQVLAWILRRSVDAPPHFLWDFVRYNFLGRRWD